MKKQKTQSKIIVALTAVVILLVAISATLTFAYFTANANETSDTMTFGKMGINIDQYNTQLNDAQGASCTLSNLVPGCTFRGAGEIEIKNNIDTFLRFRLVIASVTPRTGSALTAADLYAMLLDDNAQDGQTMTVTLSANNENTFIKGANGSGANTAWYYTKIAASNAFDTETTVISLNRVSFTLPTSLGNEYQGATFNLKLEVQAIQAEHLTFVDTENSNAITDVDVTITNGVITALGDLEAATAWPALDDNTSVDYFGA